MMLAFDSFWRGVCTYVQSVTKGNINKTSVKSPKAFSLLHYFFFSWPEELQFIGLLGTQQGTSVQLSFS